MSLTVNGLIRDNLEYAIKDDLGSVIYQDSSLVSAYDLLQVGKKRYNDLQLFCSELKKTTLFSEFIKDIDFYSTNQKNKIVIAITLNDKYDIQTLGINNKVLIEFDFDQYKYSILNSHYFDKRTKDIVESIFLNSTVLKKAARWGIRNNFHQDLSFKTTVEEQHDFIVNFTNNYLGLSLPNTFDFTGKFFDLYYKYDQNYDQDWLFRTDEGIFRLSTNVFGVKNMLIDFKNQDISNRVYAADNLLKNLMIEKSDLPEYLEKEATMVKARRLKR